LIGRGNGLGGPNKVQSIRGEDASFLYGEERNVFQRFQGELYSSLKALEFIVSLAVLSKVRLPHFDSLPLFLVNNQLFTHHFTRKEYLSSDIRKLPILHLPFAEYLTYFIALTALGCSRQMPPIIGLPDFVSFFDRRLNAKSKASSSNSGQSCVFSMKGVR